MDIAAFPLSLISLALGILSAVISIILFVREAYPDTLLALWTVRTRASLLPEDWRDRPTEVEIVASMEGPAVWEIRIANIGRATVVVEGIYANATDGGVWGCGLIWLDGEQLDAQTVTLLPGQTLLGRLPDRVVAPSRFWAEVLVQSWRPLSRLRRLEAFSVVLRGNPNSEAPEIAHSLEPRGRTTDKRRSWTEATFN